MTMIRTAIITAVLYISICANPGQAGAADILNRSFTLGTPQVELGNVNGPITVTVSARGSVQLGVVKSGGTAPERARLKVEIQATSNTLKVSVRCDRWFRRCGRARARLTLQVPHGTLLSARSVNGAVEISEVRGEVGARTVNGRIRIHRSGAAGLSVSTVNGKIRVTGHAGPLKARSVNGPLQLQLDRLWAPLEIRTVSGDAQLKLPQNTGAQVELRTVSGTLDSKLPLQTNQRQRRRVRGTLGQGGPRIQARTVSGSLTILPL